MGRAPCCAKVGLHRGPWTPREDTLLTNYIQAHGEGHWKYLPKKAGLLRCGKSCRLRWMNYLRPDIKRGNITPDEDDLIIRLHTLLGNRWSLIAGRLPGRTDNEIKNYWNTHLSKSQGTDPNSHKRFSGRGQDPKKRKNNSKLPNSKKKKHHIKNMQKANNVESEMKPKIHLPKPTRFTPFSLPRIDSFDCNTVSGSSSHACPGDHDHHAGGILLFDTEGAGDVPCTTNFKETSDDGVGLFFVGGGGDGDEDHDLFNGSDFECQSHVPTADNSLEKLYEEYLQLLKTQEQEADRVQLDSFAESLFI